MKYKSAPRLPTNAAQWMEPKGRDLEYSIGCVLKKTGELSEWREEVKRGEKM